MGSYNWEGNRQEGQGLQMEEIGCKHQMFFISPLSSRRKPTTSVRFFSLKILCCHDDSWFHLYLPCLKLWATQCIFLMEMFFLSYVNETVYLLWNLPFFKMVPPKTNFWLITAQQTSILTHCCMAGGWHTSCHPISQTHNVGEGPGGTPSALRCLYSPPLLTDIEQPVKTRRGHAPPPFWCLCQAFSVAFYTSIKLSYTKLLSDQAGSLVLKVNLIQRSRVWHHSPWATTTRLTHLDGSPDLRRVNSIVTEIRSCLTLICSREFCFDKTSLFPKIKRWERIRSNLTCSQCRWRSLPF